MNLKDVSKKEILIDFKKSASFLKLNYCLKKYWISIIFKKSRNA